MKPSRFHIPPIGNPQLRARLTYLVRNPSNEPMKASRCSVCACNWDIAPICQLCWERAEAESEKPDELTEATSQGLKEAHDELREEAKRDPTCWTMVEIKGAARQVAKFIWKDIQTFSDTLCFTDAVPDHWSPEWLEEKILEILRPPKKVRRFRLKGVLDEKPG